jgi:hypothetical protein
LEFEHLQLDLLYFLQHVHLASALAKKLGQEVSIDYIYGLLHRHQWCKPTPRLITSSRIQRLPKSSIFLTKTDDEKTNYAPKTAQTQKKVTNSPRGSATV